MDTNDPILRLIPPKFRAPMVLSAGIICMLSYGVVYTFGNLLPYLVSYMRWKYAPEMTSGSLIWLQTLMSGVPFSMLIGGILERKLGGRAAGIIGSLLYTGACVLSYYAIQHSFGMLLFTFGLITSFGGGVSYNAVLITAQRWMPQNVGLAGGLIVGGYGCGAFILTPIQTTYINPLNYAVNRDGFFVQEDLLERVPYVFLVMGFIFTVFQVIGLLFLGDPTESIELEDEPLITNTHPDRSMKEMLCSSTFAMLFTTLTLNALWVQLTSGLYKTYGQQFVGSDLFLSLVGSFSSIFNCLSRVAWGMAADRTSYQVTMSLACALGAALMWLLPMVKYSESAYLFMAQICMMFICVGGTYSLLPFATHKCFGKTHFGVIYGVVQMSLTIAGVFAGLLSQFLLPVVGYDVIFLIGGGLMALSLILTSVIHYTPYALLKDFDEYIESRSGSVSSHYYD